MNNFYKSLTVIALLLIIAGAYYNYKTNTYVTAEFKNLRPFHDRAPVYYNGFKIGSVVKVRPNKTYTSTIVTMKLHPQDIHLPVNISANLKKERNRWNRKFDYIDLIYPKDPSIFYLKDGDRISGKTSVELESYLANQDPESLEAMKADAAETIKNLNITIQTLGDLFSTLKGAEFYSLQLKIKETEFEGDIHPVLLGGEFKDFSYTAAALKNLDYLVSSDNGVLHLAGALGVKTICLLNCDAEYRWMNEEGKCSWYDSLTIFRQTWDKKWDNAVKAAVEYIKAH